MDTSDNLALIALLVTVIQLLQQLVGTAEGYRRCGELTIGAWSRLRWRKWIPSELSFETRFATPHITLHQSEDRNTTLDNEALEKAYICLLDRQAINEGVSSVALATRLKRSLPLWLRTSFFRPTQDDNIAALRDSVVEGSMRQLTLNVRGRELPNPNNNIVSLPDDILQDVEKAARHSSSNTRSPRMGISRNPLSVSWLDYVATLYALYTRYWDVGALVADDKSDDAQRFSKQAIHIGHYRVRVDVAILFRPYVWDVLDIQKP